MKPFAGTHYGEYMSFSADISVGAFVCVTLVS